jgi:signal transduction histidine kinase
MLIFTVFGIWMLSSGFSVLFDKETEQGSSESQTFCFLFEMGYQSAEEYGEEYAVNRTLDSITDSVERDGSHLFVLREDGSFFAGEEYVKRMSLADETDRLVQRLRETNEESGENYGYCIRRLGESYYMLTAIVTFAAGEPLYLGICRELTPIYESRRELMNRYRAALLILLVLGGVCIYVLSRYMTRPIRDLDRVARGIAGGNSSLRSGNQSPDEVGELARSFNRMADELVEQARQKALEAKQKEDFTAAFAHELKTPLTSIIGYADMMNSVKMTEEEQAEAVFYIYSQGKRLESLSHKLLELVSMDKAPLEAKPVPARRLEEKMRVTMRPIWEQKGIHGKVELDRGTIYGDEDLLLSLFYNLLDNAVKAMDKGDRGFILMKGYGLPEGGYEVKVVDNGRGIPEEEISRITEAFYMVDKSRSRREGGAGIGMALCRRIINLHGGRLQIDSKPGEGTVVKVTFPGSLEAEDAPTATAQRIRAEAIGTEEKRRGNTAE